MNNNKTIIKLSKLSDSELDSLYTMIKKEYQNRNRMGGNNIPKLNFTSNETSSVEEQCEGLSRMFNNAWIHG